MTASVAAVAAAVVVAVAVAAPVVAVVAAGSVANTLLETLFCCLCWVLVNWERLEKTRQNPLQDRQLPMTRAWHFV